MKKFFIVTAALMMISFNSYSEETKFTGKLTTCENTYENKNTTYQYASLAGLENVNNKKIKKTVYSENKTENEFIEICGEYSTITQYSFLNGIISGPYFHYIRAHGGNCDYKETIHGNYVNNERNGEWITDTTNDCAGLLGTAFEWMNGSIHEVTKIIYNEGVIVAEPIKERI